MLKKPASAGRGAAGGLKTNSAGARGGRSKTRPVRVGRAAARRSTAAVQKKPAACKHREARGAQSRHSNPQLMKHLLEAMPGMPSEMFGGSDVESDEERLGVGVDDSKPGVHYFGEDGWDCGAGGGHDEVQFKVDVDFGSFCMPGLLPRSFRQSRGLKAHGLGNHGSKRREASAEVLSVADLRDVFSVIANLTRESSASLDPDIKYPYTISLETMVDGLDQLCQDFALQGPRVVDAVTSFLGLQDNNVQAITVRIVQKIDTLTVSFENMAGDNVGTPGHFDSKDSTEKLDHYIRHNFGAANVQLYSGSSEVHKDSCIALFDILTAKVSKDRGALFRARVQTLYVKERHGHIWGDEDPAGEREDLEERLYDFEPDTLGRKRIHKQIAELEKRWRGYNDSSYNRRDAVTVFIHEVRAKKAVARVRISKRVYRECCCINPFSGDVEL